MSEETREISGKTPDAAGVSSSSSSSSSIDWGEVSKTLDSSTDCVFTEPLDNFLVPTLEGRGSDKPSSATMIMDGLETITHVALSEPQHYSLSFDSYKPQSDSDDNPSPSHSGIESIGTSVRADEPATAGERTPGSPGSATGTGDTITSTVDDTLNTPVSTSADVSAFFSIVTSIPDAVPITGTLSYTN